MKPFFPILAALLISAPALAAEDCTYKQPALSSEMLKARTLIRQDNPLTLVFSLRSITQKEPKNALAWSWRATAEEKLGEHAAALDAADHALGLNSCDDETRELRAQLEMQSGLYAKAYDDFSLVIKHDPKNAEAHELRGGLLLQAAEMMAALADFEAALKLGPPNVDLLLNYGGVLQEFGHFKAAVSAYDRALEIEPDNLDAQVARGYTKFFLEDFAGAADDLRHGSKLNENALAWYFLAQSRLGITSAADDFAKEAKQLPAESWMHAVSDHFLSDKPDDDLLAKLTDPEERCDALFYLGEIALAKKEKDRAQKLMLAATDACPIDPRRFSGSLREYVGAVEELKRM